MRKFKLFILFVGILSFLGFHNALKATPENSDAKIAYFLDGEVVVAEQSLPLTVGGTFTPDAQTIDGTFLYWTINGAIIRDLPEVPTIRVTSKLHMKAYYVSSSKHAVVFLDTNLQVLKTQYAVTDETLVPPADPTKPKTTFAGWVPMANYEEGTPTKTPVNPNVNEYFVARYTKDVLSYTVKLNGASIPSGLNETIEASSALTNPVWKDEHGNILGCGSPLEITVFGNIDITAYEGAVAQSDPYVTLRGPFSLREGYVSYIGKIAPGTNAVVEYGFEYTKSETVYVAQTNVINAQTNEFLMTFLDNGKTNFKAYLKYMSGTDVVKVYSASAPKLTGTLYHWMPGAVSDTTGLVATVDLYGASYNTATGAGLTVKINDSTLTYGTDYTIVDNVLSVKGQALENRSLALGTHQLSLTTIFGTGTMPFYVVESPVGTSIPTTTIQGVDMTSVAASAPIAPIANAPDLLITEMGLDRGTYDYIEVFNNTTEPYNLKNHRIVFGFFQEQDPAILQDNQLFTYPGLTRGAVFIYEDYIIPALSKAIIWVAATNGSAPWEVTKTSPFKVSIKDASLLYGEGGLTIAKFKQQYNLGEDDLVFFTRPQFILFNNTSAYSSSTGLGAPVTRTTMVPTNSSVDNRAIQIQKLDPNVIQALPSGDTTIPEGATYFKWDFGVANKEKDVIVNGVISGVQVYGNRESIEAFYIRRVFYNASDEFVGYSTASTNELNVFGGLNEAKYKNAYKSIATPIATAIFYADLTKDGETITNNKWNLVSLEYTVPSTASYSVCPHLMRFVQRDGTSLFSEYYAPSDPYRAFKLAGLAPAVTETLKNKNLVVPVDTGYPRDYLVPGYMTIDRTAWYNFYETEPTP